MNTTPSRERGPENQPGAGTSPAGVDSTSFWRALGLVRALPARSRYALAIATVTIAAAARLLFLQVLGTRAPFITFSPAVILAALFGGLRAGVLATVLSMILVDYFWIEPTRQFSIGQPGDMTASWFSC